MPFKTFALSTDILIANLFLSIKYQSLKNVFKRTQNSPNLPAPTINQIIKAIWKDFTSISQLSPLPSPHYSMTRLRKETPIP